MVFYLQDSVIEYQSKIEKPHCHLSLVPKKRLTKDFHLNNQCSHQSVNAIKTAYKQRNLALTKIPLDTIKNRFQTVLGTLLVIFEVILIGAVPHLGFKVIKSEFLDYFIICAAPQFTAQRKQLINF